MKLRELFEAHEWRYGYFCACGAEMNSHQTWERHILEIWEKTPADSFRPSPEMVDPLFMFPVVSEAAFDSQVQCAVCNRIIEPGKPFQSAIQGFDDEENVVTVLMCVYCDPNTVVEGVR